MAGNLNFHYTGVIDTDDGTVLTTLAFAGNNSRPLVNPTRIQGMNNPDEQAVHFIGPLPVGLYRVGTWGTYPKIGEDSAPLTQIGGETYGRGGFFIHGPGTADPMNSSEGCIVVPFSDRIKIMAFQPDTITVSIA